MSRSDSRMQKAYTDDDLSLIAESIAKPLQVVKAHSTEFEAAAMWYRLSREDQRQIPPSVVLRKLSSVGNACRRLLKNLAIENIDQAADGPGDHSVFDALASVNGMTPDKIASSTDRIARMAAVLDGIAATYELERSSRAASKNVKKIGDLTVFKEHRGHKRANDWIGDLLEIYRDITGSEPVTSVSQTAKNEGVASGPLIRFLQAAGKPIGIKYDEDAWRSHVRTILKHAS